MQKACLCSLASQRSGDEKVISKSIEGIESCVNRRDITDITSDRECELQDHCQLWKKHIDSAEGKAKVMFLRMMHTVVKACR